MNPPVPFQQPCIRRPAGRRPRQHDFFTDLLTGLALLLLAMPLHAESLEIDAFYGHYAGVADQIVKQESERRRLTVTIEPQGDNFLVDWSTRVRRADQSLKDNHYRVLFRKTRRGAVYASAMRINVFGKQIPMDPLAGDPFVWARIQDRTLTVYALMITDEGSYDMQVYDRTLLENGDLDLSFSRILDGGLRKEITARLHRISD
ncbi:hypothetical protein [Marinobacterium aestuariivivens]|uniref:DUF4468 domain-containing protein n=1 Tax=Marinobacterium aestuariivivens TaxID=1698799 RepID=A0ABW2A884_9GAMM